ncbi:MAG: helix-turn-helix transcriptional regulator [Rhodospirillales bacterium]|nr:helix-turn-helix transcriptional regulator [Rhodospirillales bacterium]
MLKHSDVWRAIDALALDRGYSPSGLARQAGLDPTTFNKSKRISADGKQRWPSTESISKILRATDASLGEFLSHIGDGEGIGIFRYVPLIGFAQAGEDGFFDDAGYPVGGSWDEIPFPGLADDNAYALEISGDSMDPAYRDGDTVIVSPQASVRRGDRVVVRTRSGEIMAKVLRRQTAHKIELGSINPKHADRELNMQDVDWVARIVWSSQ